MNGGKLVFTAAPKGQRPRGVQGIWSMIHRASLCGQLLAGETALDRLPSSGTGRSQARRDDRGTLKGLTADALPTPLGDVGAIAECSERQPPQRAGRTRARHELHRARHADKAEAGCQPDAEPRSPRYRHRWAAARCGPQQGLEAAAAAAARGISPPAAIAKLVSGRAGQRPSGAVGRPRRYPDRRKWDGRRPGCRQPTGSIRVQDSRSTPISLRQHQDGRGGPPPGIAPGDRSSFTVPICASSTDTHPCQSARRVEYQQNGLLGAAEEGARVRRDSANSALVHPAWRC